ncbi:MAG: beta-propeller fold lactonase family protein [Myxococcota bacterium]|jgi:DNA-binding beta-propeller fold protein YncE|nr:beta-propeller fold lactonase family protein [Myxococcota bacterium]
MPISRALRRTALAAAVVLSLLAAPDRARALVAAGPIVNPANGHHYFLLAPASWSVAETEARALGGHLVAIGDDAENTWVWTTFRNIITGPFWIGLTDVAQEGTFVWTSGDPFSYSSWWVAGGEPNNAGGVEHFVEINNGLWNDNTGVGPLRGIVEVERAFGFVEAEPTPPDSPPASYAGAIDVAASPDGDHVYALLDVFPGDDLLLIYERATDGALTLIDSEPVAFNPSAMAISPDGTAVFVATNNGEVQAWQRAPATGLLTFADGLNDNIDGGGYLQYAYGLAVSPDGDHVYVASGENAITCFAWDAGAGDLALIETDVTGSGDLVLSAPGPIAVTPDGAFVLVASQLDAAFVVLDRNPVNGTLGFVDRFVDGLEGVDGLDGPSALAVAATASGAAAYVSNLENELAVFSETLAGPAPGVAFVEAVPIGELQSALAVSPDGTLLYTSNRYDSRVTAYERDPATGAIGAVVAAITDGDPGVDGLGEAGRVAVSPDGLHLYVASPEENAIVVLEAPLPAPEPGSISLGLVALLGLRCVAARNRTKRALSASGSSD